MVSIKLMNIKWITSNTSSNKFKVCYEKSLFSILHFGEAIKCEYYS